MTYKKAGVNIDEANDFVKKLKPLVRMTERAEVLGSIGGFGGLFAPRLKGMKKPVLVASTDGVGTKLMIADLQKKYDTIGIDLVAMNVDDVAVLGAEPLFFLDYIACGRLDKNQLLQVVKGIARGCRQANCALIGGETAELPGLYEPGKWDLAGFCVGLVEAGKIIDGRRCRPGDKVIGLASSGLHSNGYSLARRVFTEKELKGDWGRQLLKPTKIYTPVVLQALKKIEIKAMAHITGGGFYDNIPRVIPEGLQVRIRRGSWPVPRLFKEIQKRGEIADKEMFRTLNMGIGLVAVVAGKEAEAAVKLFEKLGERAWIIGELVKGQHEVVIG
ncbi:MAG TPA: phosphoribosylformylglycinamidine cyclo-ligase [Candidatus Saccharicenans sp.]|nr:phosphoribosylformylglycinamidine cyclo-ligase [Candidatus Saccharicenans sp.]HNT01620.1 phosphoribosylformylglycinamidine cyclo-ligase [Candidatus Saccharicenans sp.]HPB59827.1 phosphoribosylformylglycinamidine cyclo-ligase [Candidatus Saccharicenans sp.]HQO76577.1 phosphoribosylformylglycinamidine cyclo-ligase [Candidatus Saccharicenans sp.]